VTRLYEDDAELYDIAFDWDISRRGGLACREIAGHHRPRARCGGGRMLEALADRGCRVVGFDRSPRMVEISRRRLGSRGEVFEADMTHFDLGRTFDGAVCPINTLLHLSPAELGRHLHWTRAISNVVRATSSRSGSSKRSGAVRRLTLGSEPR